MIPFSGWDSDRRTFLSIRAGEIMREPRPVNRVEISEKNQKLRIVAAVFIIFHHYQQLTGVFFTGELNFHGGNFDFGYLVELFFILSGFLAYNIVDKKELSFSEFYLSKLKRLLPLVFISCIVYEIFLFLLKCNKYDKNYAYFVCFRRISARCFHYA